METDHFIEILNRIDRLLAREEVLHEAKTELRQAFDTVSRAWGITLNAEAAKLEEAKQVYSEKLPKRSFLSFLQGVSD